MMDNNLRMELDKYRRHPLRCQPHLGLHSRYPISTVPLHASA